jgi:hypothetical protein
MGANETKYWNEYKAGAQLAITLACGAAAVPAPVAAPPVK